MSVIVPTITTETLEDYKQQIENISFAPRVHIDISDGQFSPTKTTSLANSYWPEGQLADIHMMVERPLEFVETMIAKKPHLVVLHAESESWQEAVLELKKFGLKVGVALLPETEVNMVQEKLPQLDHVLIFGGKLGFQGGQAELSLLRKIEQIRGINSAIEIGWDGGANSQNIAELSSSGIDVINVGSAIQKQENSKSAYDTLVTEVA